MMLVQPSLILVQKFHHTFSLLRTYEEIKQRILNGKLIHADETHVSVRGKDSYVWVFTSMEEVIYIWSETREGHVATEFLENFTILDNNTQ